MNIARLDKDNFDQLTDDAARIIRSGGVIILPFDTVYGFLCDARNKKSINKIFSVKKRPINKTIGLAASDTDQVKTIAELDKLSEEFVREKVPGKYTFILKSKKSDISSLCKKDNTIGIRIPKSKLVLSVLTKADKICAQTSANLSGAQPVSKIDDVLSQLDANELEKIELIIDGGPISDSVSSTIIDLTDRDNVRTIERR